MTIKENLNQYRYKAKKAENARQEYDDFMTRATKMTASLGETTAHTNKVSDKVGDNASKLADLKTEYQKRWIEAEEERIRILKIVDKIEDPYGIILKERYINEKNFEEISVELKYSYDWTTHLHGIALRKYQEYLESLTWCESI